MRAAVSSGRSLTLISEPSKLDSETAGGGLDRLDRGRAALARTGKGGGAHRADDDLVGCLDRLERVAGIDRAHESGGRLHLDDVGNLRHVEHGGDARQHVLAHGGGRREQHGVILHQRQDGSGRLLGEALRRCGASAMSTLRTPSSLAAWSATARHSSPTTRISTSPPKARAAVSALAVAGARRLVVVLCQQKDRHLQDSRLVLQFVDQRRDAVHLDAGLAGLRLGDGDAPSGAARYRRRAPRASSRRSASSWPS